MTSFQRTNILFQDMYQFFKCRIYHKNNMREAASISPSYNKSSQKATISIILRKRQYFGLLKSGFWSYFICLYLEILQKSCLFQKLYLLMFSQRYCSVTVVAKTIMFCIYHQICSCTKENRCILSGFFHKEGSGKMKM